MYITTEIIRCNGPQLPCYSEDQILDGFWERFGVRGMTIARQAFAARNGMWCGAPVTILRFQPHHDPYFAIPLLGETEAAQDSIRE